MFMVVRFGRMSRNSYIEAQDSLDKTEKIANTKRAWFPRPLPFVDTSPLGCYG